MILHIAKDEKFIDCAYIIFEKAYPKGNEFIIISPNNSLKYIKIAKVKIYTLSELYSDNLINEITKYEAIILHGFYSCLESFVLNVPAEIPIIWFGFGFDYYNRFKNINHLFLKKTKKVYNKNCLIDNIKNLIRPLYKIILRKRIVKNKYISRIDYFAPILENEYALCKNSLPNFKAKYILWQYYDLSNIELRKLASDCHINNDSNDLLLGNSSSYTNNHIEAIDILINNNLIKTINKIIIPLNYGDMKYQKDIIKYTKEKLGEKAIFLLNFIPFNKYNEYIKNCRYVIMNHLRQQAMGNIIFRIISGASIFLNEQNPAYEYFNKLGVKIFNINDLKNSYTFKDFNLSKYEIKKNQEIIYNNYNLEKSIDNAKNIINLIKK